MKTTFVYLLCLLFTVPAFCGEEPKAPDDAPINNKAAPFKSKAEFDYRPLNEGQQTFVGFFAGPGLQGLLTRTDAAENMDELTFHAFPPKDFADGKKAAEGAGLCAKASMIFYDVAPGGASKLYKTETLPGSKKDFCELKSVETDPKAVLAETRLLVRAMGSQVWVFRSKITRQQKQSPGFAKGAEEQAQFVLGLKQR